MARDVMADLGLQCVNFVDAQGARLPGLVPTRTALQRGEKLSIDEQAVIFDAELLKHIDFVYFRRFSDCRSSQVAAYVVDNSEGRLNEQELAELHWAVWLQGRAPLLYVSWGSRIDILACARGPDFWNKRRQQYQYKPAKQFELGDLTIASEISEEIKKFSAFRLADGTFWDDPDNGIFAQNDKAAHQSLIQAVVEADSDLDGRNNPVLRRLLLIMVLVKHLEDRGVFPGDGWFGRYHVGARSFFEVLQGGDPDEVDKLLKFLERKFNGDVFDLSRVERRALTKVELRRFAHLVEARTIKRQRYLWSQFSFRHLPVEIISHLYQHFVVEGAGAVYTPPFLAALLLDHVMPYNELRGNERVLDPACGSGVFLVGAFRRLVNSWRSKHDWKRPSVQTLKEILARGIFGVDLTGDAIDLTAFSLSLAVCDALKPDVIWNELKFEALRDENLVEEDFFRLLLNTQSGARTILDKHFDVVIGNPPFVSALTDAGIEADGLEQKQHKSRGSCPDNQAAYLFLEQALGRLTDNMGRACLIQPSGLLYNSSARSFWRHICRRNRVRTVFDFTSIRKLYEADPKTVAIFADAAKPENGHWVEHWTFRRTVSVKERICFELDHYDRHRISQEECEGDWYVWRANLHGGGRLINMSRRLRELRKLSDYVETMKWDYGEGFIAAKTGKRKPADFLTGKQLLPTEAFTEAGIDESQIKTVEDTHFRSAYTADRYSPPLVLIKEHSELPVAFWEKGFMAYRDKIVGVHAPWEQCAELREVYSRIRENHGVYQFCCTINGSQSLVGKQTAILKQDIDSLPYPEKQDELMFSFWEEALCEDVLEYIREYIGRGQNSRVLQTAADEKDLYRYASMFVKMLGSVYGNLRAGKPIFLQGLTCQPFYFGEQAEVAWLDAGAESALHRLVHYENSDELHTVRMIRIYDENVILIVKPDRLRYWIRSTAIRDADETLVSLTKQGY